MDGVIIAGTGLYAPGDPIPNEEVLELAGVEFDAQKIEAKIGIKTRHIAHLRGLDETAADFAEKASLKAIEAAGIGADDINLFVVASDTPEYISPATAILLQGRLQKGQQNTGAFDIASSCASFTTALDAVARMVACDPEIKYAVVVGVYNMPAFFRPGDAFGYSIFADGAGAFVLKKCAAGEDNKYITGHKLADGTQWDYIGVYSGGARQPITKERLDNDDWGLQLLQRLPGDRNITLWPPFTLEMIEKAGYTADEIDHYIFTQINASVIKEVMSILKQPIEKAVMVMDKYGYTGSGCIPMALSHAITEGKVKSGDKICTVASGAGLSVAGNIFIV